MNLRRLRYFVVVAEELHFGRAAKRLHMAQPPLSQQIRQLETELGVALFERSTRRVRLTEAGDLLYPEARQLLTDADGLERRVVQFRSGDGGTLRLGFVDSASYETMPRFLRAYRERWPEVTYELRTMSSDAQHAGLMDGSIDLGIGRALGDPTLIDATIIVSEKLSLAVPVGHVLSSQKRTTISRLKNEAFIGFDRRLSPSLHGELEAMCAERQVRYDPIMEAGEYTTILGLVAAGEGIAVVPSSVQTFKPPELRYLRLSDRSAVSSLLLLTRRNDSSPLVSRGMELATALFG